MYLLDTSISCLNFLLLFERSLQCGSLHKKAHTASTKIVDG